MKSYQSMQKEIKLLKCRNHNLKEENNKLKSCIEAILKDIKHFFRIILLFGNDKPENDIIGEIMEYYDNKYFSSKNVYNTSKGMNKEELFDYYKITNYMQINKKSHN